MTIPTLASLCLQADDALFLDFDGTLAEIGDDPAAIHLPAATAARLCSLCTRLGGALAILSGRDLRDLSRRTPRAVWRLGGHGLETAAPGADPPAMPPVAPPALLAALAPLRSVRGVRVEDKGPVQAIHYRAAPHRAERCIRVARAAAAALPDHVAQPGKMVVEVKPRRANKGAALSAAMERAPFAGRRPIMIGDDATDEDAMAAALALGGIAVKVGHGETQATMRAADPAAVRRWLAQADRPTA